MYTIHETFTMYTYTWMKFMIHGTVASSYLKYKIGRTMVLSLLLGVALAIIDISDRHMYMCELQSPRELLASMRHIYGV